MFKLFIVLFFLITTVSGDINLGKIEYPWDVTSMSDSSWNTVLVYKVNKQKKYIGHYQILNKAFKIIPMTLD